MQPATKDTTLKTLLTLLSLSFAFTGLARPQTPATPPNIIVVLTDDQGYGDIGVHGNDKIRTPNLDRFAREATEFTRFYVSPVCSPTRASLMTGRYYYRSGVIHTSRGAAKMHGDELTIAELLKDSGYRTGIFGKWHLGDTYPMRTNDQGFDEALVHKSGGITQGPDRPNSYFDPLLWENGKAVRRKGYCTDVFFDAALDFIARNRQRPFFAYIPTNAPHTPLQVADSYADPYRAKGLDDDTARVYGMVENIDGNFGRLIAKLDELQIRRNTIVIFLSDNGPQQRRFTAGLRGRKTSAYEGGIRALSFWQWPAAFDKPRKIATMAAHIDVVPTLVAAAGAAAPAGRSFDGRSLLPLLRGDAGEWPERALFFQVHRGMQPQRYRNAAVQTDRYKLVLTPGAFNGEHVAIPADPAMELYDLENDPGETQNVITRLPQVAAELRKRYEAWFEDVKSSRQFTPGVIHVGSDAEPEVLLSRYQDANYEGEKPTGWSVKIEKAGRYELKVRTSDDSWERASVPDNARIYLRIGSRVLEAEPGAGSTAAVFQLPSGDVILDAWIQQAGEPRSVPIHNTAIGDVLVRRLPE
jgi:arylsulfatase A-like enzyme